jgi:hypothetical protein
MSYLLAILWHVLFHISQFLSIKSILYSDTKRLKDLNPKILQQVEEFFLNYQEVRGIEVRTLGHAGPRKALKILTGLEILRKLPEVPAAKAVRLPKPLGPAADR